MTTVHAGRFPRSLEAALAVPGIGLYTGSAVLSIAFGLPLPVVDGNVRRVLARVFALGGPEWRKDGPFYDRAQEILDRESPGDWNQALMELGATVCAPRQPACPACPLRTHCRARREDRVFAFPEPRSRRPTEEVTIAAAVVEYLGRILLVRRPEGRLLGRMWELPQTGIETRGRPDLAAEVKEKHGVELLPGPLLARARHAITFRRIRIEAYRARVRRPMPPDPERFLWVAPDEIASLPVSSMTRKVLAAAASAQLPLALEGTAPTIRTNRRSR